MITAEALQGHWVRDWIKAPGFEDHTTRVHWMQVGTTYADVRIPLARPDVSAIGSLRQLPAHQLHALARAEGFAGRVTLEGAVCTWHRDVNWHGTPDAPDAGTISFDASGWMIETGIHATYTELWQPSGGGPAQAMRLTGPDVSGYLVIRGDAFVIAIGDTHKTATRPLVDALEAGSVPEGIEGLFDGIHALGHWSDGRAVATLATHPMAEGTEIARANGAALVWARMDFDGAVTPVTLRCEPVDA